MKKYVCANSVLLMASCLISFLWTVSLFHTNFCIALESVLTEAGTCSKGTPYISNSEQVCYWIITSIQNYNASLAKCQTDGGSLAIIPDQQALDFVNALKGNTDEYYIGYKVVNNQLVRLDNAIQSWAPWKVGEPSGSGDCVSSFNTDGTFWDERCTAEYGAICQYPSFSSVHIQSTAVDSGTSPIMKVVTESTTSCQVSTTEPSCVYVCKQQGTHSNLTEDVKKEIAKNISKELYVDKKTLSSTIRSKTSAKDERPSATSIGYVGAVILTVIFGGIVILDTPTFASLCKGKVKQMRSLSSKCKK